MTLSLQQVSDRLDRLPTSGFHARVLAVAAASLLFDTLDGIVTGFVLADLRAIWHFGPSTIGVISALGISGYLMGALASGFVADRVGRKKTILYTLVLYSLFSASRGFTSGVTSFAALNFLTFIFIGAESSTVPPYLAELWPARVRGKLNGWMMGFFGAGIALAPVWALLIVPTLGWRWALFLTAPFALIGGLMRRGLPESPRWLARRGRTSEAAAVLEAIEAQVEKSIRAPLPAVAPHQQGADDSLRRVVRTADLLGRAYRPLTLMLWAAWFAEYGVLYAFQTFVPTILAAEGFSIVKSYGYSIVIFFGVIPAYVLAGRVVEWIDRKYTILLAFAASALFGALFGYSTTAATLMLFGGLTFFSLALGSTAIYTYTPELYPTEIRATGMGIASAWGRVGAVSLLLIFGFLIEAHGPGLLFMVCDGMLLSAAIIVLLIGPSTRGRTLEATSRGYT